MRLAIWYFADSCRAPPQRTAAREICLHMRRDPNTSYPRMRGRIQRNRSPLTAINMRKRLSHQVLRRHDRSVEHLRFRWLRQSRNPQAGSRHRDGGGEAAEQNGPRHARRLLTRGSLGKHHSTRPSRSLATNFEVDGWFSWGRRDPELAMHVAP